MSNMRYQLLGYREQLGLDLNQALSTVEKTVQTAENDVNTATQVVNTATGTPAPPIHAGGQGGPPLQSASTSGLGTGAKIGIGAALLAGGLFWWKRRKKS